MSDSLWSHGLQTTKLLCPWNPLGKNTGVGCHSLLRGIFLTQGSNPGFLHWRQIICHWASREALSPAFWKSDELPLIKMKNKKDSYLKKIKKIGYHSGAIQSAFQSRNHLLLSEVLMFQEKVDIWILLGIVSYFFTFSNTTPMKGESACQCRRHRFDPWSGKISYAAEQLSLWVTTIELVLWSPGAATTEALAP